MIENILEKREALHQYPLRSIRKAVDYSNNSKSDLNTSNEDSGNMRKTVLKSTRFSKSGSKSKGSIGAITRDVADMEISGSTSGKKRSDWDHDFILDASNPHMSGIFPSSAPINGSPSHLILKDSWPLTSRATEGEMFMSVKGRFGVPDVLDSNKVMGGDERNEDNTTSLLPDDFEACNIWPKISSSSEVEHRIHMRIIIKTHGRPLTDAKGPRELVLGVLHAMLGHWVLFTAGWLHRDASIGNVMLMLQPEVRERVTDFSLPPDTIQECLGFITDGDLAIKWDDPDRLVANRRSGTPPFMSTYLLRSLTRNIQTCHTAVDDLESFVWVLLWAILDILRSKSRKPEVSANFSDNEEYYYSTLHSYSYETLKDRNSIVDLLMEDKMDGNSSPGFAVFVDLLYEWLVLAKDAYFAVRRAGFDPQDPLAFYKVFYAKYLQIGVDHLVNLPESWDYL